MNIQILVPQYKEDESVIKSLLDSIALQQNADMNDVGVIIVNDGSDVILSQEFLDSYPFEIIYDLNEHGGVSATRNRALSLATADLIMFCDVDDMFFNNIGLYTIFEAMKNENYYVYSPAFMEEAHFDGSLDVPHYIVHHVPDFTFVHGKVYRRQFIIDNNIKWCDELQLHEDCYFNYIAACVAGDDHICFDDNNACYLWKWRSNSVGRLDRPTFLLRTHYLYIGSYDKIITNLSERDPVRFQSHIQRLIFHLIYETYMFLNEENWQKPENSEYRNNLINAIQNFFKKYKEIYYTIPNTIVEDEIRKITNNEFQMKKLYFMTQTYPQWFEQTLIL